MKQNLTIELLIEEAKNFCERESQFDNPELFGVTDGKAVGTHIEHKFQNYLINKYIYERGSSANGIDFPAKILNTDMKVTSIKQPQSSCPFRFARQKIYGLGYNLLLFVYDKVDNSQKRVANLNFLDCTFIYEYRTADFMITKTLRKMVEDDANSEDIMAYLTDRNLPADEITLNRLANEILENPPVQGYLTVSNALQWRLQYGRIVGLEEKVDGIIKIVSKKIANENEKHI
jgi:hypothetical protein